MSLLPSETDLVAAATHNFRVYRGDNWSCELTFVDESNVPVDLDGSEIIMQIKNREIESNVIKELAIGSGLTLTGAGNNILTISSDGELPVRTGNLYYDLQVTFPDGKVVTYLRGTIVVIQDVTR